MKKKAPKNELVKQARKLTFRSDDLKRKIIAEYLIAKMFAKTKYIPISRLTLPDILDN